MSDTEAPIATEWRNAAWERAEREQLLQFLKLTPTERFRLLMAAIEFTGAWKNRRDTESSAGRTAV